MRILPGYVMLNHIFVSTGYLLKFRFVKLSKGILGTVVRYYQFITKEVVMTYVKKKLCLRLIVVCHRLLIYPLRDKIIENVWEKQPWMSYSSLSFIYLCSNMDRMIVPGSKDDYKLFVWFFFYYHFKYCCSRNFIFPVVFFSVLSFTL